VSPRSIRHAALLLLATACGRSEPGPYLPELELSTNFLRFEATTNEVVPPVVVAVTPVTGESLEWRAVPDAGWLWLDPTVGVGAQPVTIGVVTSGVAPGTHRGAVRFEVAGGAIATLAIELVIASPGWESTGGPHFGYVTAIAVDPSNPDRILTGTNEGRLFISNDGGAEHSELTRPADTAPIEALALTASGRGYLGSVSRGVLRSDDRGVTWQLTALANVSVTTLSVDPSNEELVVAEGASLWRSDDGGASWSVLSAATDTTFVNSGGGSFWIGGIGELYRSDGASIQTLVTGDPRPVDGFAVVAGSWLAAIRPIDGDSLPLLLRSNDGGAVWQSTGTGLSLTRYLRSRLATDGQRVWSLSAEGVYVSADGGATFASSSPPGRASTSNGLAVVESAARPAGQLFGSAGDGLWTDDGGRLRKLSLTTSAVRDLSFVGGRLYGMTANAGVVRWDPGAGWEGLYGPGFDTDEIDDAVAVCADPRSPAVILVVGWGPGVLRTLDGGATWERSNSGTILSLEAISRSPNDPDVIWVGGYGGVFRSTNNGTSWTQISSINGRSLAALSDTLVLTGGEYTQRVDVATGATLLDSNDGPVFRSADGTLWSATNLLRRTTDGVTLTDTTLGGTIIYDVEVAAGAVWAATSNALLSSRDGGTTWEDALAPFPPRSLAVDEASGWLYVGTEAGGVFRLAVGQ
jgi:photosystem II stability/assembly factor-like uncharacterized protein